MLYVFLIRLTRITVLLLVYCSAAAATNTALSFGFYSASLRFSRYFTSDWIVEGLLPMEFRFLLLKQHCQAKQKTQKTNERRRRCNKHCRLNQATDHTEASNKVVSTPNWNQTRGIHPRQRAELRTM